MEKFKILSYYLEQCNLTTLLIYSCLKHLKQHNNDDDIGYRDYIFKSYRFTINLLKKMEPKEHKNFIIHVENSKELMSEKLDTNIFCCYKQDKPYSPVELENLPWDHWLGSEIFWDDSINKSMKYLGIEFLVSECMYEITFGGFEPTILKGA